MIKQTTLARAFTALTLAALTTACGDSLGPDEHADIQRLQVTFDGATTTPRVLTILANGPTGALTLANETQSVTAVAYDADDDAFNLGSRYELVITTGSASAQYVSDGPMVGTLVVNPGTYTFEVSVEHDGHAEFGPFDVDVTVN